MRRFVLMEERTDKTGMTTTLTPLLRIEGEALNWNVKATAALTPDTDSSALLDDTIEATVRMSHYLTEGETEGRYGVDDD